MYIFFNIISIFRRFEQRYNLHGSLWASGYLFECLYEIFGQQKLQCCGAEVAAETAPLRGTRQTQR